MSARQGAGCGTAPPAAAGEPYLNVLGEAVEHLFSHRHGLGKVPLALLLNDILARVVPVEVTDGFLGGRHSVRGCWCQPWPNRPRPGSHLGGLTSSPEAAGGSPQYR